MSNKKDKFSPESLMMSYGYEPAWSEGAIKAPVFQTSTYTFRSAEEGKSFFELAFGLREKEDGESMGLIYSRLNNPNMEILENRLSLWDDAADCAVFSSGMAAVSTCLLEFLKPGDLLVYNRPLYGGSIHFIESILPEMGVHILGVNSWESAAEVEAKLAACEHIDKLAMFYLETPANPTNHLVDIQAFVEMAKQYSTPEKKVLTAVDNTYLGPIWQKPLELGADLTVYSATKFIAGHSDLIAGAIMGKEQELVNRVKTRRVFLGNMPSPWTCWLMLRSVETLKIRMEKQAENAKKVANYVRVHPKVDKVMYLGFSEKDNPARDAIFKRQCLSAGSMLAFEVKGGEKEAFAFLNNLDLIKLAVSLGSTESLAEHPASMTHAEMDAEIKDKLGITDSLVRLSVGVENPDDLIEDIRIAFEAV